MQSTSSARYRLLTKLPLRQQVEWTDAFSSNEGFTSHTRCEPLEINAALTENVRSQMRARLDGGEKQLIEAAEVREVKSEIVMEYNKLMTEVTN